MKTERVVISDITVPAHRARGLNAEAVARLSESIKTLGLQTPITVRYDEASDQILLVAGLHRMKACEQLGHADIEAIYTTATPDDARMWEIAENLHRAELTALERDEHVAEWIRLSADVVQVEPHQKAGQQPGGVRAAARELGIDRNDARRAVKVDGLSPEAKAAARETGLDDNRSALLKAANAPPAEQAELIRKYTATPRVQPAPVPLNDFETEEVWMTSMMRVWNRGAADWRERFIASVDQPVFDRTSAARG